MCRMNTYLKVQFPVPYRLSSAFAFAQGQNLKYQLGNFVPPIVSLRTVSKKSSTECPMSTGGSSRDSLPAARIRRSWQRQRINSTRPNTLYKTYVLQHLGQRASSTVAISKDKKWHIGWFQVLLSSVVIKYMIASLIPYGSWLPYLRRPPLLGRCMYLEVLFGKHDQI